ncbi:hypothetical protein OUZ56_026189 [Daphnia magna]|uniref:Uncharacterized protein n=1 Tax=Daphnia magna TaxID=35525 RepID=A0ABQ9ZL24_9CRUS|nr:hypothetical protein OUZ56_026189 [Daphnia magna]
MRTPDALQCKTLSFPSQTSLGHLNRPSLPLVDCPDCPWATIFGDDPWTECNGMVKRGTGPLQSPYGNQTTVYEVITSTRQGWSNRMRGLVAMATALKLPIGTSEFLILFTLLAHQRQRKREAAPWQRLQTKNGDLPAIFFEM